MVLTVRVQFPNNGDRRHLHNIPHKHATAQMARLIIRQNMPIIKTKDINK